MKLDDFDYYLPRELIAQRPLLKRDSCRLLVLDRRKRRVFHRSFTDLAHYLKAGDAIVLNDTKVIPARLIGYKEKTGGKVDVLLLNPLDQNSFFCLVKPSSSLKMGTRLTFKRDELSATFMGGRNQVEVIKFHCAGDLRSLLEREGLTPLPPYIKRLPEEGDRIAYQTVYAKRRGSVAAPTAGLHFTKKYLKMLTSKGINIVDVTLHVGYGTFQPVRSQNICEHYMHKELFCLSEDASNLLNQVKFQRAGKVLAIGTTSCRVLENCASSAVSRQLSATSKKKDKIISSNLKPESWKLKAGRGWTDLFIYPPYKFKFVDMLLTNFHLPKTTLLMLVSAFCGRGLLMKAYQEAIRRRYRFYSYGDAMLIV